jgi:formiminotetrahydrofolate cyclodeaminase
MITISTPAMTMTISPDVERAHQLWEHALEASREADRVFWKALGPDKAKYDALMRYSAMPKRIANAEHEVREKWFVKALKIEISAEIARLYVQRKAAASANSLACSQFYAYFPNHNSDHFQRELAAFVLQQFKGVQP